MDGIAEGNTRPVSLWGSPLVKCCKGRLKNLSLSELITRLPKAHIAFRCSPILAESAREWNLDMKAWLALDVSAPEDYHTANLARIYMGQAYYPPLQHHTHTHTHWLMTFCILHLRDLLAAGAIKFTSRMKILCIFNTEREREIHSTCICFANFSIGYAISRLTTEALKNFPLFF